MRGMANPKAPPGLSSELRLTWLQASQGLLTTAHRSIPEMDRQISKLEELGLIGADKTGKYVVAPPKPKKPPKPNVVVRLDEYDEIPRIDEYARRHGITRTDVIRAGLVALGVLPPPPAPSSAPPRSASGTHPTARAVRRSERPPAMRRAK